MHYNSFSKEEGQTEFRTEINRLLESYGPGYFLSAEGEIQQLPEAGMERLMEASLPGSDPENIQARVDAAVSRFQKYRSSLEDRRHALRDLADVLEFLRPRLQEVITEKDESDLFNPAFPV